MKAEIISISEDFLNGQQPDENVVFLAREFLKLGIPVNGSVFVRSSRDTLKRALKQAEEVADVIVLVGGLGPGKNNVTKLAVSEYFDVPLALDQPTEDKIITYHKNSDFVMPEHNQLQALILHDSTPIRNVTGLAVGMFYTSNNKTYILLPGPADELQPTFSENARPLIVEKLLNETYVETRVVRAFGLSETQLKMKLEEVIHYENPVVTVFEYGEELEVLIVVTASDEEKANKQVDELQEEVKRRIKEFVYSEESNTLLETVRDLLLKEELKITAAESLTGGDLLSTFASLDGASDIFDGGMVTYSNEVKNKNLGVPKKVIEQFGVVSGQCAIEMAERVQEKFAADIGVSLTGVAGPSSLEGEIPGTVWIGIAKEGMTSFAKKYHFAYKRNRNRKLSVMSALDLVRRVILQEDVADTVTMAEADDNVNK